MSPDTLGLPSPRGVVLTLGLRSLQYPEGPGRPPFTLWDFPLRFDIGLAPNVAMTLAWDLRLREEPGMTVEGPGDVVVATRVRLLDERPRGPSVGVEFLTKLPNAHDKGTYLGTDNTDFLLGLLLRSGSLAGTVGLAILGSPGGPGPSGPSPAHRAS